MKEFETWQNSVIHALSSRGIPAPYSECLVSSWNSNLSVERAALVHEAEYLCNQPKAKFDVAKRCGCFRCTKFFTPDMIDWEYGHAQCPYCNTDSVLAEREDYVLTEEMLKELSILQFSEEFRIW